MSAREQPAQGLPSFSCFAPAKIQNNGKEFSLDIVGFVAAQADVVVQAALDRGKLEMSFTRRQIHLTIGANVVVTLRVPDDAFKVAEVVDNFEWNGSKAAAQFAVTCLRKAETRLHTCQAFIDVDGQRKGRLIFDLNVVPADQSSPPVSPPSEQECELQLLAFELKPGKQYHFFICHHQGSGGDQSNLLCLQLRALGYIVWYDNGVKATKRTLPGMKDGVTKSECLLLFLSGRKEVLLDGEGVADTAGDYEGPFTRWFCHEEMSTAREQKLRFVGVMETELRHGKPDFALEKSRAQTAGDDGGPIHEDVEDNLQLLKDLCFIPFRRQEHEVPAMLKEIIRQATPSGTEPEPGRGPGSKHYVPSHVQDAVAYARLQEEQDAIVAQAVEAIVDPESEPVSPSLDEQAAICEVVPSQPMKETEAALEASSSSDDGFHSVDEEFK
eukprot:COSAG02_NODE_1299_length_13382_cov_14.723858_4_plen_441_part_00